MLGERPGWRSGCKAAWQEGRRLAGRVGTLLTGNVLAQLVALAASPVLARLYTPEQFGHFALVVSAVNILSQVVTFKYDIAILAAEREETADRLLRLSLCVCLACTAVLLVSGPLLRRLWAACTGSGAEGWSIVVIMAPLVGMFLVCNSYHTRRAGYRSVAIVAVGRAAVTAAAQLLFAAAAPLAGIGLAAGQLVGYLAGLAALSWPIRGSFGQQWHIGELGETLRAQRAYPSTRCLPPWLRHWRAISAVSSSARPIRRRRSAPMRSSSAFWVLHSRW